MPWKKCPHCNGLSYSAATNYKTWICPYCEQDIKDTPDHQPEPEQPGDRHKEHQDPPA